MTEQELLRRFHEEPLPPTTVDVQRAVRDGRRRGRTRIGLSALAVVATLGAGSLVATHWPRPGPAVQLGQQTMQELRVQGQADLDRYEVQFAAAAGSGDFVPVGGLTQQVGNWAPSDPDDNKMALQAGDLVTDVALPGAPQPTGSVVWDSGATLTVPLISADEALGRLRALGSGPCLSPCMPLHVISARMTTVRIDTTRGEATVPAWEYTLRNKPVRVTHVAVASAATFTVTPPLWDPYHTPLGTSVDSATLSGRTLTLHFIGAPPGPTNPCGASYEAETIESEHAVVVLLLEIPVQEGAVCTSAGYLRTQTLTLPDALAGRALLEVRQGLPVPVTVLN
jgi:hypothetical protein